MAGTQRQRQSLSRKGLFQVNMQRMSPDSCSTTVVFGHLLLVIARPDAILAFSAKPFGQIIWRLQVCHVEAAWHSWSQVCANAWLPCEESNAESIDTGAEQGNT